MNIEQTPRFFLYGSNKLEKLAALFQEKIYSRATGNSIFQEECVITPTGGISEYLKLYLAQNDVIVANFGTLFLQNFIRRFLSRLYPGYSADERFFSIPAMTFFIFRELQEHASDYPELGAFFQSSDAELKSWQLAEENAAIIDHYFLFRADLLKKWRDNAGPDPAPDLAWQKRLYLKMRGSGHTGPDEYLAGFQQLSALPDGMEIPDRISIFGVSSMPQSMLEFFYHLSLFSEISFFYLNPCSEFWGDDLQSFKSGISDNLFDDGNPLLSSLGKIARPFVNKLVELNCANTGTGGELLFDPFLPEDPEEISSPHQATLLQDLQNDIYRLWDRSIPEESVKRTAAKNDQSVSVQFCGTIRREMEVLHDWILFQLQQGVEPRDILVMMPDINTYAPYIQSVFSQGILKDHYSIADRSFSTESVIGNAFETLLHLGGKRFTATEIMNFLSLKPVLAKAGIREEELPVLQDWIRKSGIRWGKNEETRQDFCESAFAEFSWQSGLDRLLAGCLIDQSADEPGEFGIAPLNDAESNLELLGRFSAFAQQIFALKNLFSLHLTIPEWGRRINALADAFFAGEAETEKDLAKLHSELAAIVRQAESSLEQTEIRIGFETAREILLQANANAQKSDRLLRGKITFCSMVPMRSIPHQCIAIPGLTSGTFPRQHEARTFDYAAREIRACDRNQSDEERYLFLEAVLSARKALFLSCQGYNARSGENVPPAPPLGELLDYLKKGYGFEPEKAPLWAASAGNYLPVRKFPSFNQTGYQCACNLLRQTEPQETEPIQLAPLPLPETIDLKTLTDFFADPPSGFLKLRAGFCQESDYDCEEPDSDMLKLSGLEQYQLFSEIFRQTLSELAPETQYQLLRGKMMLPAGPPGKHIFDDVYRQIAEIPEELKKLFRNGVPITGKCTVSGTEICGSVLMSPDHTREFMVIHSKLKWKYAVRSTITHLFAAAADGEKREFNLFCFDKDGFSAYRLAPVEPEAARLRLEQLLNLYQQGTGSPLEVFPNAAFAALEKGGMRDDEIMPVLKKAFESNFHVGDDQNLAVTMLFGGAEIFDKPDFVFHFQQLIHTIADYPEKII